MPNKVYMIVPNTTYPFDQTKFHNYILKLYSQGYIESWWHYLAGSLYFVGTHLDVTGLYNVLIPHTNNIHFIVMEVNPNNQQGWLPKAGWDWFNSYKANL